MKSVLIAVVSAVQAYLLGSIDTGILVSKFLYHDDVRKYGSGAAGMTNMLRTFGKKAAALTAFGDVLKGVLAVCIGRWLFTQMPESTTLSPYLAVYLAAIFAIIGHLKPLYFGFKGGKGVLVAGGTILAIQPVLIPFLAVIFLACLLPTGMVSLGSVTMAALYPVLTILYGGRFLKAMPRPEKGAAFFLPVHRRGCRHVAYIVEVCPFVIDDVKAVGTCFVPCKAHP